MFQSLKIYNQLFIRLLVILVGVVLSFYLLQKELVYSAVFSFFVVVLLVFELYRYLKNAFLLGHVSSWHYLLHLRIDEIPCGRSAN